MRLRTSILQQSAAAAKRYRENKDGSDNEHDDGGETGVSARGSKVNWLGLFEEKDRAGTGTLMREDVQEVLIKVGKPCVRYSIVQHRFCLLVSFSAMVYRRLMPKRSESCLLEMFSFSPLVDVHCVRT